MVGQFFVPPVVGLFEVGQVLSCTTTDHPVDETAFDGQTGVESLGERSEALAVEDLRHITGQKPLIRRARKSIASFKLREGLPIGVKVTLRRNRMWEFMDRLLNVALPRVRDFKGVNPKGFDGNGNFTMGIKEQIIFPEIDYDKVDAIRGMNITFVTSATTNEHGRELLRSLGMPFRVKRTEGT